MNHMNLLSHRIDKIHGRLSELYQSASASPTPPAELLPTALVELGIVSEALQHVMRELTHQREQLVNVQNEVEVTRQQYNNLFEFLTDGYLVTDQSLVIQEANRAAANLFNIRQDHIVGKLFTSLVHSDDRLTFQSKLMQVHQRQKVELSVRLQRSHAVFFNAALAVNTVHTQQSDRPKLQWLIRDVTEQQRTASDLSSTNFNLRQDRPVYGFNKGEMIPLESGKVWLVSRGVVKLTTMSERGEEMLVGLVRESMIFGSSLTALHTYEAIALAKVQLLSIPLTEISQSPPLAQALLPLISQRLRQTESFLSIYGQLRVEDRLSHLLELLKRELGQQVDQGSRLAVRLTHQDFASACCTTRVTITRLLGKLQQEGRITFDTQNHLIIRS